MGLNILKRWQVFILFVMGFVFLGKAQAAVTSVTANSDATNLYYAINYTDAPSFFRVFLDTDVNATSGFPIGGIGANYLIENRSLYVYSGSGGSWSWSYVKSLTMSQATGAVRWTVARTDLKSPTALKLIGQVSSPVSTSGVISQNLSVVAANAVSLTVAGAPNLPYNGTSTLVTVGFVSGTPTSVALSRDGLAAFASWPSGTFFKLSADGKSLTGNWCITAACWSNQPGAHVLNVVATYADGSTKSASVSLNVSDSISPTPTPTPTPSPTTVSWIRCASEGGVCSFSGTRQVRYGANNIYAYKNATGSIACDNATFGDPVVGVAKYCDYNTTVLTSPSPTPSPTPAPTPTPTPVSTPTPTPTPVSSGPTYYVSPSGNDANSGSSSAPWRTIQKAANSVSAGATVILMNGTYEEPSININVSGTATAPITFKAQNKWQAIVSSYSGCNPGISAYGSYITLKDLRLTISPRNVRCSAYSSANTDVRAWNARLATPTNPSTGTQGFVATGLKLDGLQRDVGLKSNQDYSIIENTECNNLIELFGDKDSVVRKNVVTGQDRFGNSIVVKGGVRNVQVYGNIIYAKVAGGPGIIIGGSSCDTCAFDTVERAEAYNTVAYNNVVINQSTGLIPALVFQGAKDSAFINNVVINGSLAMLVGGQAPSYRFPTTNPIFRNNIVMCNGGPLTTLNFGWSYSGTMNNDYNNFYNCSGAPAQSHPIAGDPMFVNPTSDWHLQSGSPAINSGAPFSMPAYGGGFLDISRDYNGVVRSTPWDLGIYNVTP